MFDWTTWLDHITEPSNVFRLEDVGGGLTRITPAGTVMQQGTPQDQTRFNNIEDGILDAHAALEMLINFARQQAWEVERGSVVLTNTDKYPFNNSKKSVALSTRRESTDYLIMYEVAEYTEEDGCVGDIEITDKLVNGFKMAFTGSTSTATVNYVVIGGYMK